MNPNKINIQDMFVLFLVRNMIPIIAGTNWNDDIIGAAVESYPLSIDVADLLEQLVQAVSDGP